MSPDIGHSYEADLWALGVIMFTLVTGRPPFQATNLEATYARIKR
jgi:serine/threonine protein kinase